MTRYAPSLLIVLALAATSGCSQPAKPTTSFVRSSAELAILDRLSFGRTIPSIEGEVTEDEWTAFLNEVVTPRFPGGFVTWATNGQWRNPAGAISHERGWIIEFNHADTQSADRLVSEVAAEYKRRFKQEAVFRLRYRVDASEI